jgi:ABC-type nitrate/sulfonate/bicarbonate transport system ATPase subunit
MLTLNLRRKSYPGAGGSERPALAALRLQVRAGEWVCLVGPSGSGKTTLLNIIGGLDPNFDGDLRFSQPPRIGTVFQSPRLMPWLTVRDNVALVLRGTDAAERAERLLSTVGMQEARQLFPSALSGGMKRRVALARAFAVEPTLLLMDEPLVSLDAPVAQRLRTLMLALWQRARPTVIYVTHDLREALALGDRVLFLSASPGRIVRELPVTLPRPRGIDDAAVGALHAGLLRDSPQLLAGDSAAVAEAADV